MMQLGLPIPNVEYKIDNPNTEGVGEILVKGPNVMLGYYEDEQKTKETITLQEDAKVLLLQKTEKIFIQKRLSII